MTAREVLERLTPEQRFDIAIICTEMMPLDDIWEMLRVVLTEDEKMEMGLRIKNSVAG